MSQELISRSPDLQRLRDEGYGIAIRAGHLLVQHVPYVDAQGFVRSGTLVTALNLAGDRTTTPADHVVRFAGDAPCDREGRPLEKVINSSADEDLGGGIVVNHLLSNKPPEGYGDFYAKMTAYVRMIAAPATAVDPAVTATPFPVIEQEDEESPFAYVDTASSLAGIGAPTEKFRGSRIAIVGVGGTGSYVLDMVAKTPVGEIHLYDDDDFSQHNAFRAPGAASIEELREQPAKVNYLARRYSPMHRRVIPHLVAIDTDSVAELDSMDFVFLAIDDASAKRVVVDHLEKCDIAFVDAGMGLRLDDDAVAGILRVTTSAPGHRDHVHDRQRIPFGGFDGADVYSRNIQVADLNALNACLAVIAWKKYLGFYRDLEHEHFTTYTVDGNHLLNEDQSQ